MHCRSFINILLEVEVALANYRSTYLRFKQVDVVASACLRYSLSMAIHVQLSPAIIFKAQQ